MVGIFGDIQPPFTAQKWLQLWEFGQKWQLKVQEVRYKWSWSTWNVVLISHKRNPASLRSDLSLCLEKSSLGYVLELSLRYLDLEPPCLTKFSYIKPFSGQKWGMVVQKNTKQVRNAYGLHQRYQEHIPSWLTSHKPHFMDLEPPFLAKFR